MVKDIVDSIVEAWNSNLKHNGLPYKITLSVSCRKKTFYVTKDKSYEQDIAELKLIQEGTPTLLLFRKELRLPPKVKNEPRYKIENAYIADLYKTLLYEALGSFAIITQQAITNKDYSEYDINLDRIKPDPLYSDTVIETTEAGEFYEVGDRFDVFTKLSEGWAVYTAHESGRANNGIAKITGICKEIKSTVPKLDLINP